MHLSHDFGLSIYNIDFNMVPKFDLASTAETYRYGAMVDSVSNKYNLEMTVTGIISNDFNAGVVATSCGESMVMIIGSGAYLLKDWAISNIVMSDKDNKIASLIIISDGITNDANALFSFSFKDGEYDINKSDYANVYNVYGSPKQFTYKEYLTRAVTAEL